MNARSAAAERILPVIKSDHNPARCIEVRRVPWRSTFSVALWRRPPRRPARERAANATGDMAFLGPPSCGFGVLIENIAM
jgi:hypothetical protein